MTENDCIVLSMVRSAVNGSQFDASPLKGKRQQEWSDIFRIASEQGVLALCCSETAAYPLGPQCRKNRETVLLATRNGASDCRKIP